MPTDFSCFSLFVRKVKPEHVCQDFIWKISEKVASLLEPTENFMLVKSMNSAEECILTENVTPPHEYPCIAKWIIYDYCNMYCTTASRDGKLKHVCVSVHTYP